MMGEFLEVLSSLNSNVKHNLRVETDYTRSVKNTMIEYRLASKYAYSVSSIL